MSDKWKSELADSFGCIWVALAVLILAAARFLFFYTDKVTR